VNPLIEKTISCFPFVQTVREYKKEWFRSDFVSGLTVALMEIPQSIAYAMVAGLPPIYGIYSSFVVAMVYSLMGSSHHVVCGTTNAISLVVASTMINSNLPVARENPAALVGLLTLMVGILQVAFGFLKIGNLSQFISRSVLIGFTAGAGVLIALNQLAPFFGIQLPKTPNMVELFTQTVCHLSETNGYAVGIALWTVAIISLGSRFFPRIPSPLLAVVSSAFAVYIFDLESKGVSLVGNIPASLPPFTLPLFDLTAFASLASSAIAIALLACIQSVSVSKSISMSTGQRINNNQDFIGLGLAHTVGAFFLCMPSCGSFTRSALNLHAGARTRFSAFFSASWVAVILLVLAPSARYIPVPTLAALLIVMSASMVKWKHIQVAVHATRSDAIVLIVTFICVLVLHLETAIFIGIMASLALFLRKASAPHLVEYDIDEGGMHEITEPGKRSNPGISIIHVEGELFFGAADLFEEEVRRLAADSSIRVVILRMKRARHLDATAVMALDTLLDYLRKTGRLLLISGATPELMRVITKSGLGKNIGDENIFPAEENLTVATRKALLRAKQFIGGSSSEMDIRIFYPQNESKETTETNGAYDYAI